MLSAAASRVVVALAVAAGPVTADNRVGGGPAARLVAAIPDPALQDLAVVEVLEAVRAVAAGEDTAVPALAAAVSRFLDGA